MLTPRGKLSHTCWDLLIPISPSLTLTADPEATLLGKGASSRRINRVSREDDHSDNGRGIGDNG